MCRWRRHHPRMRTLLNTLNRKVDTIMATQAQLDALVTRLNTAVAGIRQDIADIKAANPAVDFSALEESIGGLEGLDAENPAPPAEPGQ